MVQQPSCLCLTVSVDPVQCPHQLGCTHTGSLVYWTPPFMAIASTPHRLSYIGLRMRIKNGEIRPPLLLFVIRD
jgi:hypothetical protein